MCPLNVLNVSIRLQNATHTTEILVRAHVRVDHSLSLSLSLSHTHTHTRITETPVRAHVRVNDALPHEKCDDERVQV